MSLISFYMQLESLSITHKSAVFVQQVFERASTLAEARRCGVDDLTLRDVRSCVAAADIEHSELAALRHGLDVKHERQKAVARHQGALA